MDKLFSLFCGEKHEGIFSERYKVGVVSGSHRYSGLDAEVTVVLIGKGGRSEPRTLKRAVAGEHKGPHVEVFYLNTNEDLEDLGAVELYNSGGGLYSNFELLKIVVDKTMEGGLQNSTYWQRWIFPCYSWIGPGAARLFFTGTASLPRNTPWWLDEQRHLALARAKQLYPWGYYQGLPAGTRATKMVELPKDEHLPGWHDRNFKVAVGKHIMKLGLSDLLGEQRHWTDLGPTATQPGAIFHELYSKPKGKEENPAAVGEVNVLLADQGISGEKLEPPACGFPTNDTYWEKDAQFAREFTQGPNPVMLKPCYSIPAVMEYAVPLVSVRVRAGRSLADEARAGRVFLADYSMLASFIPDPKAGSYVCAPMVLFYVVDDPKHKLSDSDTCLLPIAIRLHPLDDDTPIFTPDDPEWDWKCAKAAVLNADSQVHMIVNYYLKTLAVVEPFAVSMHRNLSTMHPIFKLLRPYMRYLLAYNAIARESLMSNGGIVESLFSLGDQASPLASGEYMRWKFEDLGLAANLAKRGLDGEEYLPEYPYRDDGLLVWAAIIDFVREYVRLYYSTDAEVEGDQELQAWYVEALNVGHGRLYNPAEGQGIDPLEMEPMVSINALAKVLVYLIWTTSGQNTALTRGSYESYGFVGYRPARLRYPVPTEKGQCTRESFLAMLPDRGETTTLCSFMHWRSLQTKLAEPMLGSQAEEHLLDPDALDAYDRFQDALRTIQHAIHTRNNSRGNAYDWLLPSVITNGVAH